MGALEPQLDRHQIPVDFPDVRFQVFYQRFDLGIAQGIAGGMHGSGCLGIGEVNRVAQLLWRRHIAHQIRSRSASLRQTEVGIGTSWNVGVVSARYITADLCPNGIG